MSSHSSATAFKHNLDEARALLGVEQIAWSKKTIDQLLVVPEKIGIVPKRLIELRQQFGAEIDKFLDNMRGPCLISAIVLCVTALEVYLCDLYERLNGKAYEGRPLENVGTIERAFAPRTVFKDSSQKETLDNIFEYRHVIVHKAGQFDSRSCIKLGIPQYYLGRDIVEYLDVDKVNRYLDYIGSYVEWLDSAFLPSPLH